MLPPRQMESHLYLCTQCHHIRLVASLGIYLEGDDSGSDVHTYCDQCEDGGRLVEVRDEDELVILNWSIQESEQSPSATPPSLTLLQQSAQTRRFTVRWDNQREVTSPHDVRECEAEGLLFSDGTVVLHLPGKGYEYYHTREDMRFHLELRGYVQVTMIDPEPLEASKKEEEEERNKPMGEWLTEREIVEHQQKRYGYVTEGAGRMRKR